MTHVWQAQQRGWWYVIVFGAVQRRYSYRLESGKRLADYGIEQQAEIVRHAFMARKGWWQPNAGTGAYQALLDSLAA
jgi:hypothetical protein